VLGARPIGELRQLRRVQPRIIHYAADRRNRKESRHRDGRREATPRQRRRRAQHNREERWARRCVRPASNQRIASHRLPAETPAAAVVNCIASVRNSSARVGCTCGTRPHFQCSSSSHESGTREQSQRRQQEQEHAQLWRHLPPHARARGGERGEDQQVARDGGGGPRRYPAVRGSHSLQRLLTRAERGEEVLLFGRCRGEVRRQRQDRSRGGKRDHRHGACAAHQQDAGAEEWQRGGRVIEERGSGGNTRGQVSPARGEPHGADQQRHGRRRAVSVHTRP